MDEIPDIRPTSPSPMRQSLLAKIDPSCRLPVRCSLPYLHHLFKFSYNVFDRVVTESVATDIRSDDEDEDEDEEDVGEKEE